MISGAAARVLTCFLETDVLSFSELCEQADYPTDLGGYYIRQLVSAKYLEKSDRGKYAITSSGRQQLIAYVNRIGMKGLTHPRLCVILVCRINGQFVILRRRRQPFIGRAEWPAGSVKIGESLAEAAVRIMNERIGIQSEPRFIGFFRRIDMQGAAVFDDKLFAAHICELEPDLSVSTSTETGDIMLVEESKIWDIENPAAALFDVLRFTRASIPYQEKRYELTHPAK